MMNNQDRASAARDVVDNFAFKMGIVDEDMELKISDLMADLYHLADQYGIEMQECIARGYGHYICEMHDEANIGCWS